MEHRAQPAVEVIPATKRSVRSGGGLKQRTGIRVAAYCRVSTGDESQQTSYTNQRTFYTAWIRNQEEWSFVGIYADEAASGTSRAGREGFNRMMKDAMDGKLDYIVTKSISRFARNTVDTLSCIRQLKALSPPVGVYFEKENIDTLDAAGELILTILSALAQDESRSISENIRWTFQRNFQAGKPQINLDRMLGYDKGPGGEWLINQKQAEMVRMIFQRFINGASANGIAAWLNQLGKRTVRGKRWTAGGILVILRNEKYVGDLEMQKTITKSFLTHRSAVNNGEAPRYYVKDHHEGIVDRLTWDKAQALLRRKKQQQSEGRGPCRPPFENLRCGICGGSFVRMTYNGTAAGYTDERSMKAEKIPAGYTERYMFAFPVWRCRNTLRKGGQEELCPSERLYECAVEQSFMEMLYRLRRDFLARGNESQLAVLYSEALERVCRRMDSRQDSGERVRLLELQILEAADEERREALIRERDLLQAEQEAAAAMKRNYERFRKCILALPEKNEAGRPLCIYGLDTGAYDYLSFEKGIYRAFIQEGIVKGDVIEYTTNFGVRLVSRGNSRTLEAFIGFVRNGTEVMTSQWQVNGRKVQYIRRKYP